MCQIVWNYASREAPEKTEIGCMLCCSRYCVWWNNRGCTVEGSKLPELDAPWDCMLHSKFGTFCAITVTSARLEDMWMGVPKTSSMLRDFLETIAKERIPPPIWRGPTLLNQSENKPRRYHQISAKVWTPGRISMSLSTG